MAFEIENGILKKYVEELGVKVAIIPKGVTVIQEKAFQRSFEGRVCRMDTYRQYPDV